jgi:hypothetical protein
MMYVSANEKAVSLNLHRYTEVLQIRAKLRSLSHLKRPDDIQLMEVGRPYKLNAVTPVACKPPEFIRVRSSLLTIS